MIYFELIGEPFEFLYPLKMKFPFETRTIYVYTIGYVYHCLVASVSVSQIIVADVVYSGGCQYAIAHLEHVTGLFVAANEQFAL